VYTYTTVSAPLAGISGTRDVYLVFDSAALRLSTFAVT
jgi:hypothetical protein